MKNEHEWADIYKRDEHGQVVYQCTICLKCGAPHKRGAPLHGHWQLKWNQLKYFAVTQKGVIKCEGKKLG